MCLRSSIYGNFFCHSNHSIDPVNKCHKKESNGTYLRYWDGRAKGKWVRARNLGNGCFAVNENGTTLISTGTDYQLVELYSSSVKGSTSHDNLIIIFESAEEYANKKEPIYATNFYQTLWIGKGTYDIRITETNATRLSQPYTKGCIKNTDLVSNRFSQRYTYKSCRESCAYDYVLKECNEVVDIWKKYHTEGAKPSNTSNFESTKECLRMTIEHIRLKATSLCPCQSACEETIYTAEAKKIEKDIKADWRLYFMNENPVTSIQSVPDFPSEQFLGAFGGVIGLGGKYQVIFQLFLFILLFIMNLVARSRYFHR